MVLDFIGVCGLLVYLVGWLAALAAVLTCICVTVPYPAFITKNLEVALSRHFIETNPLIYHLLLVRIFV